MNNEDKKSTIMIVDDTPANQELLADMLKTQGFHVVQFPNGPLALQAAGQLTPDLILMDIMMPIMDGFEVCRQLKANEKFKEVPVIFISSLNDIDSKVKAFSQGGADYVTKPFQEKEVISRVYTHLKLKRQNQEIRKLLSETLTGSVKAFNELLAISYPQIFRRTLKICMYVRIFYSEARLENGWMFEIAANLLNLASLVPHSNHSEANAEKFARIAIHPLGPQGHIYKEIANIVRCIPRLDIPATMIENITTAPDDRKHWRDWDLGLLGGHILAIASAFESQMEKGLSEKEALQHIYTPDGQFLFNQKLLCDFGKIVFNVSIDSSDTATFIQTYGGEHNE